MARFKVILLILATLAGISLAQSAEEHIWSVVALVLHGDRTPPAWSERWGSGMPRLTPLGAQQMLARGSLFRERYLSRSKPDGDANAPLGDKPIVGIQHNVINNNQLEIWASTDYYTSTSALAFLQGFYPPILQTSAHDTGGLGDGAAVLANGSILDYPLGGYQYPRVRLASSGDPDSMWIDGHTGCPAYTQSLLDYPRDSDVVSHYARSLYFYRVIYDDFLFSEFPSSMANFYYASELYEHALFLYNHFNISRSIIKPEIIEQMRDLASTERRARLGNLTASGPSAGDMIRAISGRTMAGNVLSFLRGNIHGRGKTNKFNLVFTSPDPFIAFFALSHLDKGPSKATFEQLPSSGATMVFELLSTGGSVTEYPSPDDLSVRFLYSNGTEPGEQPSQYSLFGREKWQSTMSYSDFRAAIGSFGISSTVEWCRTCDSNTLFCTGLEANSESGSKLADTLHLESRVVPLNPAVAGIMGAAVTMCAVGLALLASVIRGLRFYRVDPKRQSSTFGGFKGATRMSSDTDVAIASGGKRCERACSWELQEGSKGSGVVGITILSPPEAVILKPDVIRRKPVEDDAISEMGHTPVRPREF